jgi:hypothetical protein
MMLKRIKRQGFGMVGAANDNVLVGDAWTSAPAWLREQTLHRATAPKGRRYSNRATTIAAYGLVDRPFPPAKVRS